MKRIFKFIRRAIAFWLMRELEIQLHDQKLCLAMLKDGLARESLKLAICRTAGELVEARANYLVLLPIGERMTWGQA